jgi:hypothetical protein
MIKVGILTLKPLLAVSAPTHLLNLLTSILSSPKQDASHRLLASALRALRNVLLTTADLVWGHVCGVGAEQKVVDTGLIGDDGVDVGRKGKGVMGKSTGWKANGSKALSLVFEVR